MKAFRPFEIDVIVRLLSGVLSAKQIALLKCYAGPVQCEYTGFGYFLTVSHDQLPAARATISTPTVIGEYAGERYGFVVLLGDFELTLECHGFGSNAVAEGFRDRHLLVFDEPEM
jgi:hypothetical protein